MQNLQRLSNCVYMYKSRKTYNLHPVFVLQELISAIHQLSQYSRLVPVLSYRKSSSFASRSAKL
jgi:hypothetical protein